MIFKKLRLKKVIILVLPLIFIYLILFAQGYTGHNWYFGGAGKGIVFGKSSNEAQAIDATRANPATFGMAASAVATDPVTGKLLFYSNGSEVYDANHSVMPNGGGLPGNPNLPNTVAIVPVPENELKYYVFVIGPAGNLTFSIVDMEEAGNPNALNFNLGDVTQPKNVDAGLGTTITSMKIISNGPNDHYLIVQDAATQEIRSYRFNFNFGTDPDGNNEFPDPTDFSLELISSITIPVDFPLGNLSFSATAGKIALASSSISRNIFLVDFDPATGILSNPEPILNSGRNGELIYDVEWSADGSSLYFTRFTPGGPNDGHLYRVESYDTDEPVFRRITEDPVFASWGLKRGPDGKIYHIYQTADANSPYLIGVVNLPNQPIDAVDYLPNPFSGQDFQARQFPEVSPAADIDMEVDFTWYPENMGMVCQNSPVKFIPDVTPPADSIVWDFGDGSGASQYAPRHIYEQAGPVQVTMTAYIGGEANTVTKDLTITQFELQANAQDTTACSFPILYDKLQIEGGQSYQLEWSFTDATGEQVTIEKPGNYWVVVTDLGTGCQTYAPFTARLYGEERQTANVWYFGNGAGLDFNEKEPADLNNPPPYALTDGQMNAPAGTSTISDQNGDLLFYTDGQTVWNKNHQIMDGGTDIGGNPNSTQSSLIVPFPGDETMFYIFTTEEIGNTGTYALKYSIVDMKLNKDGDGFLGAVVSKDNILFTQSTERITATGLQGGGAVWLIAHEYGSNNFLSYLITEAGISNPVISSVGNVHSAFNPAEGQGYMKLSPDNQRLAVVIQPNTVQVFTFVDSTGVLSNPITITVPEGEVYGVEFAGNKLFVSTHNNGIFEYYLRGPEDEDDFEFEALGVLEGSASVPGRMGAIQIAPNGQIYVAIEGANFLGAIYPNPERGEKSNFQAQGADLGGRTSNLGLPNFIQNLMESPMEPSMQVIGACVDNEILFVGTGTSDIDEFEWRIFRLSDNQQVNGPDDPSAQETTHIFTVPGSYEVSLRVYNVCGFDTLMTQVIEIFENPDLSGLPDALSICDGGREIGHELPGTEEEGYTYQWSGGENPDSKINLITVEGIYTVLVTNPNGCSEEAEIFMGPPFEVNLGEDRYICKDDVLTLDSQANANPDGYRWFRQRIDIPGSPQENLNRSTRTFPVDTSIPGTFIFRVEVQDPLEDDCWVSDEIEVYIGGFEELTYDFQNSTDCEVGDGWIELTNLPVDGDYTIIWYDETNSIIGTEARVENLSGGLYSVIVTDNINGCTEEIFGIGINDAEFDIVSVTPTNANCDGEATVQVELSEPLTDGTYRLINTSNNAAFTGPVNSQVFSIAVTGVTENTTFTLEVRNSLGCVETEPDILIEADPRAELDIEPVLAGCDNVNLNEAIVPNGNPNGHTVEWFRSSDNTPVTDPAQVTASGNYYAIASGANFCPSPAYSVAVTVTPEPLVDIDYDYSEICDGIVYLVGNLSQSIDESQIAYIWTHNGNEVGTNKRLRVNSPGDYFLTARYINDPTCSSDAIERNVTIPPPFDFELTAEPSCDDGSNVVLTVTSQNTNLQYMWLRNGIIISGASGSTYTIVPTPTDNGNGTYSVDINTSDNRCRKSQSLRITRTPIQRGTLRPNEEICPEENQFVTLNPGNFSTYEWTTPNGTFTTPTVVANVPGTYRVRLGATGCFDEQEVIVQEVCSARVYAPNAFKPGGRLEDNTSFSVSSNQYVTDFSVFIYNRWGELIFHSTDKNFKWDGRFNGKDAPGGTYAYVIRFKSLSRPEAPIQSLRGGVLLMR
jgi:gliding motility-associated-like protein